ncbi:MAG: glycosyltransferase family 61 protein [Rhizobiales bacterium]|nr:glycosyltransferase family 61 protein [Hyphomicrobiales bacterium]
MIRNHFNSEGIGELHNLQVLNFTSKVEWFIHMDQAIPYHLGKNQSFLAGKPPPEQPKVKQYADGIYFYWYTFPLMNYYHCINDGLGPLYNYLKLRAQYPNIKLMLNPLARTLDKHPPFVTELLELLDIDYRYSDENTQYSHVFFSDTLCNDPVTGKRCPPDNRIYSLIQKLVTVSRQRYPDVPAHDKVYLSRRAHANPLRNRKDVIGEDNTVKRGLVNEDSIVDILKALGYTEVFGENYNLGEKISMFSNMTKYISTAGAGVTNILWRINRDLSVGGIHTPGFPFPSGDHNRHIVAQSPYMNKTSIDLYKGEVVFEDPQPTKGYNHPWRITNLDAFRKWAETI